MDRRLQIWALVWGLPGIVIQGYGIVEGLAPVSFGGTALLCVGLMYHIRAKGYHPMWGLWGVVPVMGPILLLLQPRPPGTSAQDVLEDMLVEEDPHIRAFARRERSTVSGGLPLLLVMAPIGILILLFSAKLPHAIAPAEVAAPVSPARTSPAPIPPISSAAPSTETAAPAKTEPVGGTTQPPSEQTAATTAEKPGEPAPPEPDGASELPAESSYVAKYLQVRPGLTYEQVCEVVGHDSMLISGTLGGDKIVKWRNPDKSFFAARFRNNVLERVTDLGYPPPERKLAEMAGDLKMPGEGSVALETDKEETAKELPREGERAAVEEPASQEGEEQVDGEGEADQAQDSGQTAEDIGEEASAESNEEPAAPKNVVRVEPNVKPEPRPRKVQLPRFTQGISRGPHDVFLHNETDATVTVGLRTQAKRGRDLTIPPGGVAAVYLSNGTYNVFYIDTSQPYELKSAGELVIASPPYSIHLPLR